MSRGLDSFIAEAMAKARTRSDWNARLVHWERPASEFEEAKIQRSAGMARDMVAGNAWLVNEGVSVEPQGSYYNNTNVRTEADMDLRVVHPSIYVQYAPEVIIESARQDLGYSSGSRSFAQIAGDVYREIAVSLMQRFGGDNVDLGNKAIRVKELSGSRADVDVVPAMRLHHVHQSGGILGGHYEIEGVAILARDNTWTFNYPEQHHSNGKAKRERTRHRFKKVVRQLKRLNYELAEMNMVPAKLPSFLVECLVYAIEDPYFLVQEDRYERLVRILRRIGDLVSDNNWAAAATEINGLKPLFIGQPWTVLQVQSFVLAALVRLEA